ncbi:sensor histidine kinase [Streptomyces sp. RPT161]|uniref:sensor histidine kinase n=1 Tax=Streptomyces sp. RPT161 TaxID=3015993 RepID=UPI0022B91D27|nr:histidine kinase [Streptomyces sp. RPT161]
MSSTGPDLAPDAPRPGAAATRKILGGSRFADDLFRPFIAVTAIAVTAAEFPDHRLIAPTLTTALFALVSLIALGSNLPWDRLPEQWQIALAATYAVLAAVLLPLARPTLAPMFAFIASAVAGAKLPSRRAAFGVAITGALSCAVAVTIVSHVEPTPGQWPWWLALSVGLPVYIGISRRDRQDAVDSARRAAAETRRAAEWEAQNAALRERGRIAREIHDVLGHSLSGIALQLDMADALSDSGRADEATAAIRRARAMAVDSIAETRRAVHALREDTLPLHEALRLMADGEQVDFTLRGEVAAVTVETAQTVIRAAQEALTNAVKYAPGAARTMTLEFRSDSVLLTVVNGPSERRHPASVAQGTGVGLVGMRERAALLGGTLRAGPDVDGGSGAGWIVRLEVPR